MKVSARARRWLSLLWVAAVLGLIGSQAVQVEWTSVLAALREVRPATLAVALALSATGYLACASYDLVGRHVTGHRVSLRRTVAISFVGYTFSLNLGALVGGLAFRYRLYAPAGLSFGTIARVISLSVVTNWSGYVLMAGGLLLIAPPGLPERFAVSEPLLRGIGAALLATIVAYGWLCVRKGGETLRIRSAEVSLPGPGLAAIQLGLSLASWSAIGAVVTSLLPADIGWLDVMPVLLTGAIVGVVSHVPAGLGVLEAVFTALLGDRVPLDRLLAALLAYRAVYYLLPMLVATGVYALLEAKPTKLAASLGSADSTSLRT